jgi:flagellar export protein FliJ
MKTFTFSLERVRQWREKQVTLEEAELQRLFSERSLLEERRKVLEQEARESATAVVRAKAIEALELQAIDAFHRYVVAQRAAIAAALEQCDQRIDAQRTKLLEAQRRFELLEKLKERKLKAWTAAFAREIEAQAGDLFLAKWSNQQSR